MQTEKSCLASFAKSVFLRETPFSLFDRDGLYVRLLRSYGLLQGYLSQSLAISHDELAGELKALIELHLELSVDDPDIERFLEGARLDLDAFRPEALRSHRSWCDIHLGADVSNIPHMLSEDALRYIKWTARELAADGCIVELGCWLGAGTRAAVEGYLSAPLRYASAVHAYDAFIWAEWMTECTANGSNDAAHPSPGESFRGLFDGYLGGVLGHVKVHPCAVEREEENLDLPPLSWHGDRVAFLIMDFADDEPTLSSCWRAFQPCLIPNRSIVMMNQLGNARAWEVRQFCREHGRELRVLHAPHGAAWSFVYSPE